MSNYGIVAKGSTEAQVGANRRSVTELDHRPNLPGPWVYVDTGDAELDSGDSPDWLNGATFAGSPYDYVAFRSGLDGDLEFKGVPTDVTYGVPMFVVPMKWRPEKDETHYRDVLAGGALVPSRWVVDAATGEVAPYELGSAGLLPVAYAALTTGWTAIDGQDYCLTGLDGTYIGPNNAEGVADTINLLNDDGTFVIDEAIEMHQRGLFLWSAYLQFDGGAGFGAGITARIFVASNSFLYDFSGAQENVVPAGDSVYAIRMTGMGIADSALGTELCVSVLVTGDDLDVTGGRAVVTRLTAYPDTLV